MKIKNLIFLACIILFQSSNLKAQDCSISAQIEDTILFNSNLYFYSTYEWDFGNGMFSIEENPSFLYHEPGNYEVSVTAFDACCPEHDTTKYFIVHIGNNTINNMGDSISISPNPVIDLLNINYTNFSNSTREIVITRMNSGTIVKSELLNPNNQLLTIDVSDFVKGYYCVSLIINQTVSSQKFVFIY